MGGHHHHRHRSVAIKNIFIYVALAAAIIIFVILTIAYKNKSAGEQAELEQIVAEYRAQEEAEEAEYQALVEEIETNYSFYQKLSAGYDVNILVIGDSIGASSGASSSDYYWYNQLAYWIEETYMDGTEFDGDIYVNNVSMGGNASYAGYVRTMNLDDDNVHPNDTGYEIYLEAIETVIEEQVEADTGKPEEVGAYSDGVEGFDNFIYYGVDDEETETDENTEEDVEEAVTFSRTDDYTYTLTVSQSGILGIDYTYESGDNTAEIYIDGELYTSPTVTFDYDFSQRHILIVSSEQADGFYGMCFSWE